MSQLLTPVYDIQQIASTSTPVAWESIEAIAQRIGEGYIILWQHHAISTGLIEGGKIHWRSEAKPVMDDAHLLKIRAFNEVREYYFWRSSDGMRGRLRSDEDGEVQDFLDAKMMLRSVVGKPLQKVRHDLVSNQLTLITRNYIGYDRDTYQAGYVDSRFVAFQAFEK
ncbi:MAG: hypothetical protein KF852_18340 [Saprospiraceae bacterium]|nr:hypothetical protein [Saprospiraceae bacterium]